MMISACRVLHADDRQMQKATNLCVNSALLSPIRQRNELGVALFSY